MKGELATCFNTRIVKRVWVKIKPPKETQVLVHVSIYQGGNLGLPYFDPHPSETMTPRIGALGYLLGCPIRQVGLQPT